MALAGMDALRVLQQFRRGDEQITRRYLSQNHILNDIRSDVYVSGTYVRDYLLEPDTDRADAYRASLEEVRQHMESALESYRRQVAPTDAQQYSALRAELLDNWGILAPIFHWDPAERRRSGYAFLRDEVFPRRQNMLALAARIDARDSGYPCICLSPETGISWSSLNDSGILSSLRDLLVDYLPLESGAIARFAGHPSGHPHWARICGRCPRKAPPILAIPIYEPD